MLLPLRMGCIFALKIKGHLIWKSQRLSENLSIKVREGLCLFPCPSPAPSCRMCLRFPIKPRRGLGGLGVSPSAVFRVSSLSVRDTVVFISPNLCFLFSCLAGSADGLGDRQGLGPGAHGLRESQTWARCR